MKIIYVLIGSIVVSVALCESVLKLFNYYDLLGQKMVMVRDRAHIQYKLLPAKIHKIKGMYSINEVASYVQKEDETVYERAPYTENCRMPYQFDEILLNRFTPNTRFVKNRQIYEINSLGWREYEYSKEKPENVVRIAIVGDSFVEGLNIDWPSHFSKVLERELNKLGTVVEVLSFGFRGYETDALCRGN